MIYSRDETHRVHERPPGIALAGEDATALGSQTVEAAPPLPSFLNPPALQPAALLQPVQERVERRDVELQLSGGSRFNQFADFVAMTRALRRPKE
jgi:hypothetical protein